MIVFTSAYGTSSSVGGGGHSPTFWARATKYMAKRLAKNISSLDSQMIVPTRTPWGRLRGWLLALKEGAGTRGAVVTGVIMSPPPDISRWGRGPPRSPPTCTAVHLRILLPGVVRRVVVEMSGPRARPRRGPPD